MNDYQKNIVPAVGQNKRNIFVHGNDGFKILFVGNSITKHAPKADIGWERDCGMAASSLENDYVHQLIQTIRKEYRKDTSYAIVQAASFEFTYSTANIPELYAEIQDYDPDIMIMFIGANVTKSYETDPNITVKFGDAYEKLRNYLCGKNTVVFHSQGFYIRSILDKEKEAVAKKYGDTFIHIEDIRTNPATHDEIYNHPNDFGMEQLAERFWQEIKNKLLV